MTRVLWVEPSIEVMVVTEYKSGNVDWDQVIMEGFKCQIEGCKLYPIESRGPLKGFQQEVLLSNGKLSSTGMKERF